MPPFGGLTEGRIADDLRGTNARADHGTDGVAHPARRELDGAETSGLESGAARRRPLPPAFPV